MNHFLLPILTLLLMLSPAIAEEKPRAKPHLYDYQGGVVDPLCFLNNIGTDEEPVYPTVRCEWEELVAVGDEPPLPDDFVSTYYEIHDYDPETDEAFISGGFIGYRVVGHIDGHEILWLVENGGGTGTFTSLMKLETIRDDTEETTRFINKGGYAFGDRCMGGILNAWMDDDGALHYEIASTMADMFNLAGHPERDILKSEAYQSLPYCAACCYAVVEFSGENFHSVTFKPDRHKPDPDIEAASCIEDMVNINKHYGIKEFSASDFGYFIRELEHVCLGRTEGD